MRYRTAVVALALLLAPRPGAALISTELALQGLSNPVRLVAPVGDPRLFVVERGGLVRVFDQDGTDRGIFLDVSALTRVTSERGLLGLAFAPDYASSGIFYVALTDPDPGVTTESQLYRFAVSADPDVANPAAQELLLAIFEPQSNHNGGHLEFGPDGMLYWGLGDGGGGGDLDNHAQDLQDQLGKLLRLDVSAPGPPRIPPDNPFIGETPLDEIWALGLRNPWTFSFDRATGDLYIADVGQMEIEEIDVQPAMSGGGENYGWHRMEGSACYNPTTGCDDGSLVLPVHEYPHGGGRCSISGGYVYRGTAIPDEIGTYFFADYCSGQFWGLRWDAGSGLAVVEERTSEFRSVETLAGVSSFGQDGSGELYVIENGRGRIHRIISDAVGAAPSASFGHMKARW